MKRNNSLIMERDMDILTLESTEIKVLESASCGQCRKCSFSLLGSFSWSLPLTPYLHMEHFWLEKEIAATLGKCTWASLLSLFGELKFWQRYPRLHSGDMFKVIQCPLSIAPSRAWKFFSSFILSSWTSYLILFHTHKRNTKPQERKCMHAEQKEMT